MASVTTHRQDNQAVYVLHTYPFKETSLVVELFARDFGRVATTAKGARRPRSAMRGLLQGEALMCGFYLNELLLRLLPREDPHEALFEYYADTLKILASGQDLGTTLRRFELKFLQELGYAIPLEFDVNAEPILASQSYRYEAEHGAFKIQGAMSHYDNGVQLSGKTLIDMAHDDYVHAQTKQQSKQLMRYLLAHYLGDKPLYTRQLLIDLQDL